MKALYWVLLWCGLLGAVDFLLAGVDKRRARRKEWRIPEKTLLGLALLGGAWGLLAGMLTFHHKTRKPAFAIGVPCMLALHTGLVLWLLFRSW